MTYAEKELLPLGFKISESTENKVVLSLGHLKLQFDCCCSAYPNIKTMGCPLHHSGLGSSWPVDEAKKIVHDTPMGLCSQNLVFRSDPQQAGLYWDFSFYVSSSVAGINNLI